MNYFYPDVYQKSIYTINYDKLKENGIKCLLFDLDNTCVPYVDKKPTKKLKNHFDKLKDSGFTVIIYKFSYVIFAEILSLVRKIKIFNLSNSKIVNKSNQCEFNAIREVTLNVGRVTGYTLLLLAGLTQSAVVLNIVTIILTLSLLVMSINLTKVKKNNH